MRAALLVLAAASAAVVAWAGALDLRILTGASAARTLTAGSYILAVLFGIAIALLVNAVAVAMMRGAKLRHAITWVTREDGAAELIGPPGRGLPAWQHYGRGDLLGAPT